MLKLRKLILSWKIQLNLNKHTKITILRLNKYLIRNNTV